MQAFSAIAARAVETAANRVLALDEDTAERLRSLQGHTVAVTLEGPDISFYVQPDGNRVRVIDSFEGEPDAAIRATPGALFVNALQPDRSQAGRVHITGDAHIAQEVQQLLKRLHPDWEEPLAQAFGDVVGPKLAAGIREGVDAFRKTVTGFGDQLGEYLREESRHLVSRREMQEFLDEVDQLRDAVDRLDARIQRLNKNRE